ncbi:MAG: hypothetical protein CL736_03735 [Chloroflexi bacterium]|nr:hypothetical protein [Chloroflexota bacterium]
MFYVKLLIKLSIILTTIGLVACNTENDELSVTTPTSTPLVTIPVIIPTPTLALEKELERVQTKNVIAHIPQGTLSLASPKNPEHFDVHEDSSDSLLSMGPGISYSRLLRFNEFKITCDICIEWIQVSDIEYHIRLREDVFWHDKIPISGRKLIAKDVVESLNRIKNNDWSSSSILNSLDMVEEIEESKVRILLKYPDADLLMRLAHGNIKIIPYELQNLKEGLRFGPTIGTGPWVYNENSVDRFEFTANPNYFEEGFPKAQEFFISPVSNENTRIALVLSEKVNVSIVDYWSMKRLLGIKDLEINASMIDDKTGNHFSHCSLNILPCIDINPNYSKGVLFALNASVYPIDDVHFRRYIFSHLDLNSYDSLSIGLPIASSGWELSTKSETTYTNLPELTQSLNYDQTNSANLERLDDTIDFYVGDYGDQYINLGDKYLRILTEAGFQVRYQVLNPKEYYQKVWIEKNYDISLGPKIPIDIPNTFLYGMLHSNGEYSISNHQIDYLDQLIELQNTSNIEREKHIIDIQKYVLEQALLFEPITDHVGILISNKTQNYNSGVINIRNSESWHWSELVVSN